MPASPHVVALDDRRLRYAQFLRDRHGFRFRAHREAALPKDAFHHGPLGGPLRDPAAFAEIARSLLDGVAGGVKEASLVLPDAWLRVTFSESGDLPRSGEARDEVLRWKLRRLVPFRVEELRIGAAEVEPLAQQEEPRRLLLGFAVDQLLTQIEDAFAALGVRIGRITNESLALLAALEASTADGSGTAGGGLAGFVMVGEEGYTLVFARRGEPVLHRYKSFTRALPDNARASFVGRDLRLTRNFLDEQFPGAGLDPLLLVAAPELEPLWIDRLEEGLGRGAAPLDGRHLPPLRAEEPVAAPPWRELAPMFGAARQEVV